MILKTCGKTEYSKEKNASSVYTMQKSKDISIVVILFREKRMKGASKTGEVKIKDIKAKYYLF